MEDIYTIVDKAIDVAFEEQKFHLKFYDFMKSCKTTGVGAKEFIGSSTAKELTDFIDDLSKYIKGGKDGEHQILREAYGHLGKPKARKIKDYFNVILEDAKRYEKERRRGDVKLQLNKSSTRGNVLTLALTLGTLISVLFLFVGGIIGWLYKEHKQRNDISEMHPEMYDLKGNIIPDEIIAFRFENLNFDSEIDDEL